VVRYELYVPRSIDVTIAWTAGSTAREVGAGMSTITLSGGNARTT